MPKRKPKSKARSKPTVKAIPAEQDALLRAIVANPDDHAARLVYADWLQENGDEEQATYIREWVRVAGLPEGKERDKAMGKLCDEMDKNGPGWMEAIGITGLSEFPGGLVMWPPIAVVYRSTNQFFDDAPALFARVPVRELYIDWFHSRGLDGRALRALSRMPELARLTKLHLANYGHQFNLNSWKALIQSPHLGGLTSLTVRWAGLTNPYANALAKCAHLSKLVTLDLSHNFIGRAGLLAILRSPHLAGVKEAYLCSADEYAEPDEEVVQAVVARFGSDEPLYNQDLF